MAKKAQEKFTDKQRKSVESLLGFLGEMFECTVGVSGTDSIYGGRLYYVQAIKPILNEQDEEDDKIDIATGFVTFSMDAFAQMAEQVSGLIAKIHKAHLCDFAPTLSYLCVIEEDDPVASYLKAELCRLAGDLLPSEQLVQCLHDMTLKQAPDDAVLH